VQTSQADFEAGVLNQVDTTTSPGDVKLATASEAIAFVKNIGTNQIKGTGTSISVTVPAAGVKAGNSIIVTFAMDSYTGSVSVSDSKGNTYTLDADVGATGAADKVRTLIFSAHNVAALESGDTITVTHPSPIDWARRAVSANEFSGLWMTSALDKTSTGEGTSTMPSSGSTTTTSQADELLIGAIGVEGPLGDSFTVGSGYTALARDGTSGEVEFSNITINAEYRIVSATGAYAADGTITDRDWAAAIATYKMLVWDSYSDSGHNTQSDYFDEYPSENTVYMYGSGFATSTTYRVIFWDLVDSTWINRQTEDATSDENGNLSAAHTLTPGTDTDGNWHVTVYNDTGYSPTTYDANDSKLVADDISYTGGYAFYVTQSAIPEFPTVLAAIVALALSVGIYLWMRRKAVPSAPALGL
jgi:hypothetical protein